MPGNSFGQAFRITTFGESHGGAVGVVIDGCPPGLELSAADVQPALDRRRPGQSHITTPRKEADRIEILSGVFQGKTTGTPILMLAHNEDFRPEDYRAFQNIYRPGHADFTYDAKYGLRDWRGSGRASARETLARVAAGAVAAKLLREREGIEVISWVERVKDIEGKIDHPARVMAEEVEASLVRCPDAAAAAKMIALIEETKAAGDSVGGVIYGEIRGVPAGLGEPVFGKLQAELGGAMLGINAVKGFEIGSGFSGTRLYGSEHNDPFYLEGDRVRARNNRAGGVLGGISTGETIYFRVAFKPVATIAKEQRTVSADRKETVLKGTGRHDPCVLPRAVPIVDAMAALVMIDQVLRHRGQLG